MLEFIQNKLSYIIVIGFISFIILGIIAYFFIICFCDCTSNNNNIDKLFTYIEKISTNILLPILTLVLGYYFGSKDKQKLNNDESSYYDEKVKKE